MIRYSLRCDKDHSFESWFQSSSAYDPQVKRKLVSCPVCGSAKVDKAIMAPRIVGKKGRDTGPRAGRGFSGSAGDGIHAADDDAGARAARQVERAARPYRQDRRQCRRAFSQRSAQDALRRYRASPDLWRGFARGSPLADRRRRRSRARCRCCRKTGTDARASSPWMGRAKRQTHHLPSTVPGSMASHRSTGPDDYATPPPAAPRPPRSARCPTARAPTAAA